MCSNQTSGIGTVAAGQPDTPGAALAAELRGLLSGRVCIFGVGNRCRRDDGAGSRLAVDLAAGADVLSIDAGTVPENHLEQAARWQPETILIVDAVDFGGRAGEVRILAPEQLGSAGVSSHALSLRMTAEYLQTRSGARLAVVAIQPADVGHGSELSGNVAETVRRLREIFSVDTGQAAQPAPPTKVD